MVTDSVGAGQPVRRRRAPRSSWRIAARQPASAPRCASRPATSLPTPASLLPLQQATGVVLAGQLEIGHLPTDGSQPLLMAEQEIVITTSWWTTRAALDSTLRREELALPPAGGRADVLPVRRRAAAVRGDAGRAGPDRGREHPTPARPPARGRCRTSPRARSSLRAGLPRWPEPPAARSDGKRRFFFYSRPENARNLFWRGGQALSRGDRGQHPRPRRVELPLRRPQRLPT